MSPLARERAAALSLPVLLLVLPFEPRQLSLPLLGFEFTVLECIAGVAMAVLLWACRERVARILRRPPLPVALLASYAAAHVLSCLFAPSNRALAAVFSLRMISAAAFALLVAAVPPQALRRAFRGAVAAACLVAALATLEGAGVRSIDPFLDLFRSNPSIVGEARRASGGSEGPTLAAACLLYGFVPAVALASGSARPLRIAVPLAGLLSTGLAFTYSLGGLVATALALVTLAVALGAKDRRGAIAPAAALVVLVATTAAFAAGGRILSRRWSAEVAEPRYGARYEPLERFVSFAPGETRPIAVRVTNTGPQAWTPQLGLQLMCVWYEIDERRMLYWWWSERAIATRVAPAENVTIEVPVRAPERVGRYLMIWDIVPGPFRNYGAEPAVVPAAVSRGKAEAPFSVSEYPLLWRRGGRLELWRIALAMWRDHPLTGVGSDNFRWLHGAYAGWLEWNVVTGAHNIYLEAAATTGTLGLLAILGTLLATARAALHRLKAAPPGSAELRLAAALLALTLGIAAQGVVDYFLGFTGHYLFLGFVVGAAANPER